MIKVLLGLTLFCILLTGCEQNEVIILTDESTHKQYACTGHDGEQYFCNEVTSTSTERK